MKHTDDLDFYFDSLDSESDVIESANTVPVMYAGGGYLAPVNIFDDGGPYNDEFMKYYGLSWVPANQIFSYDPYYKAIQQHNPNGTYAVNSDGLYVPASEMEKQWKQWEELRNTLPKEIYRNGVIEYLEKLRNDAQSDNQTLRNPYDMLGRFVEMYQASGSPTIHQNMFTRGFFKRWTPDAWHTSYTPAVPLTQQVSHPFGDIFIDRNQQPWMIGHHITQELPHMMQSTLGFGRNVVWPFRWDNPNKELIPGTNKDYYEQDGAFEHNAHNIIWPMYMSYVTGLSPEYLATHSVNSLYRYIAESDWHRSHKRFFEDPINTRSDLYNAIINASKSSSEYGINEYESLKRGINGKKDWLEDDVNRLRKRGLAETMQQ